MKFVRTTLCIAAALLFMGAFFRPGCRIILGGTAMPGVYDPAAVYRCAEAAQRTAEEITRGTEQPGYTLVPVLCLYGEQPDEQLLYHVLLESYEGVAKLYEVSADGVPVGLLTELGDVIRLQRMHPTRKIRFTETYTYTGAENTVQEVQAVVSSMGDAVGF